MKQHVGYFGTDLVILNHSHMTRTIPELVLPSPNFHATPTGGRLATRYDLTRNKPHTRASSVELGSQSQDLTTEPPRPGIWFRIIRKWDK
ncbi:hypothetical protein AVEN_30284-1 [Araneus ventricosus]|uniref:Uncharacterized protein n=1 Tax=Araneus ventricosus TaxID=182803 RepID=A0A4Y2HI10_ARAVE|nr:hypothetical protein AVEN_30284-1 [Araneus ventricosus]